MRDAGFAAMTLLLGSLFAFATSLPTSADAASHHDHRGKRPPTVTHHTRHATKTAGATHARVRRVVRASGISCVPFARRDSGIEVPGNAWQWWGNAAGIYARGRVPQPGAVLAFRSNPHMPLGHVAVVTKIINRREIVIDHANWVHGKITRGVPVVDVSEANNWSAVRVEVGRTGVFGSVYPTYGFIYDRPDTGTLVAKADAPAPRPILNPAPSDWRPVAERPWSIYEQVAEAPARPRHRTRALQREASVAGTGATAGTRVAEANVAETNVAATNVAETNVALGNTQLGALGHQ